MSDRLTVPAEAVLAEAMRDPRFRADWERTAVARAVAHWLIRYRLDHKLTQRQLAARLGVSQTIVWRMELGEHNPKIETLLVLAERLGMSLELKITPPAGANKPVKERTIQDLRTATGSVLRIVAV